MIHEELIKALRCCADDDCGICPYSEDDRYCGISKLAYDAASAIEELIAQVKDKDCLIQQQADEIERIRRDVEKQQDKMFELAKARELKEMEAVKTWCHQRGIAMVDWPIYRSMVACYGRDPMRKKREVQE